MCVSFTRDNDQAPARRVRYRLPLWKQLAGEKDLEREVRVHAWSNSQALRLARKLAPRNAFHFYVVDESAQLADPRHALPVVSTGPGGIGHELSDDLFADAPRFGGEA